MFPSLDIIKSISGIVLDSNRTKFSSPGQLWNKQINVHLHLYLKQSVVNDLTNCYFGEHKTVRLSQAVN